MSSTSVRFFTNTLWLYGRMGVTMFVSLYTTRLILNELGAADFGIYNIVGGAIAMLGFLNATMAVATQRFMSYAEGADNEDKKNTIFNVSIILHLFLSIVAGLIFLLTSFILFNGVLNIPEERMFAAKIIYACLILSTMFSIMTVPYDALLNAHENMRYYAIVGIFESILKLAVAFACLYAPFDKLIVYGILMSIIPFITLSFMRFYCKRHYPECKLSIKTSWDKRIAKEMTSFASWNLLGTSSSLIGNYGMNLVINNFFGVLLNAAMGITQQLSGVVMTFSNNMLKAINPIIAKTEGSGDRGRMLRMSSTGNKLSFFMLSIIAIPLYIGIDCILEFWLVNIPEWTVIFVKLQIIRLLLEQLTIVYHTSINAQGDIRAYNVILGVVNIIPIILTYILFKFGADPYAMFLTTITVFGVFVCGVRVYFMHKNCGLPYTEFLNRELIPLFLSFFSAFSICYFCTFLASNELNKLIIAILSSVFLGLPCYYIIGLDHIEKGLVNGLFSKFLKR